MKPQSIDLNKNAECAAHQAIEIAVMDYFQVKDCIVDLDTNSACILFDPVVHQKWISRFNGHARHHGLKDIPVSIPLNQLPIKIIKSAQPLLEKNLAQYNAIESYIKFRLLQGKVVEGTISEVSGLNIKVSLKGGTATLCQRDAIKSEQYILGETNLFLIKRVRLDIDAVQILLSRRSKKIPEYVLSSKFPKFKFHCYRRIPGTKSWIKTTAPRYRWGLFLSKEIRQSLGWEYLQFHS
jgi:hypothetical protein